MKKIVLIAVVIFIGAGLFAHADTPTQNEFYYVFHLFKNKAGQLVADRDFKFVYDVIPGAFSQPSVGQFPYRGEVFSFNGQAVGQFQFDAVTGKISVQAPYVADAQRVVFYDSQNQPVLTIPVSDSSYCNDNGICESDQGEDYQNCSNDCKSAVLPSAPATPSDTGGSGSSGILSGIIYTVIGLVLLGGGWWFLKKRRGGGTPPSVPPMPQIQMPTPPTPPSPNNPV